MVEYIDKKGNKLEKGFYFFEKFSDLYYFSDKYDSYGSPLFESIKRVGREINLQNYLTIRLTKIEDTHEIKKNLKRLKESANWLEERIKEFEK